jgi:formate dehydrogenase major subunit
MLQARINNKSYEFEGSVSILKALRSIQLDVPTLCSDDRLKPCGNCRLCLVTIKGMDHPVTACTTMLADGMEIETHTPQLEQMRAVLLGMQARDYPNDALTQFPDKEFHRLLRQYAVAGAADGTISARLADDSHPYIHVDMSRCIDCRRCVRICEELQGQGVWGVRGRGKETRIVPDSEKSLKDSSCVSCGACVDTCPTGALEDKSIMRYGLPEAWMRTTCPYCGTGCEMKVGTSDGRIISVRPVIDAPVNRGHLCVKGRYAFDFVHAQDRVSVPMIRRGDEWKRVSWEHAIAFVGDRLKRIREEYGANSIGVLASARATNEENYLTQKFARVVLGTNNVDSCARVCHAPTAAAMKLMLGTGAATNSFDDIERARVILVCGANPTENHPVIGARIKRAVVERGAKLIIIDPRRIELAPYSTHHLRLHPGTNVPLLNAMAHVIVAEGLTDKAFIEERVAEYEEFKEFIGEWSPERAAEVCGVAAEEIRAAARLLAGTGPAMSIHGLGLTEHTQGTEGVMCLVNLALLTGNLGKPGAGINPLRGQNNVQGAAHMGCDPGTLTGGCSIMEGRALFETVWRAPVPVARGLNMLEMMDAAGEGKLKALWAIGYDILLTNADANATGRALHGLELVIVQDMFFNETARQFGTVFLPACSSFEKDGTFMNAERRVQRVRRAIEPVGQSKPDWRIVCEVAHSMGRGELFDYGSPEEVWNEIRAVWKMGSGITYERMETAGLQWPCPTPEHSGTRILHSDTFPTGKRATLRRINYRRTTERTGKDYPLLLTTGRTLYQFNAGTMTMRTANRLLHPTDYLDISMEDAERLGLREGERVRLCSRYGEAVLPLRLNAIIRPGELFATFHTGAAFLNRVTGPLRDRYVKAPEYKVTAVRLEKLEPLT